VSDTQLSGFLDGIIHPLASRQTQANMHRQQLFRLSITGTAKFDLEVSLADADDFAAELAVTPIKQREPLTGLHTQNLAQIVGVILTQSQ
jgi:hypothetical protein